MPETTIDYGNVANSIPLVIGNKVLSRLDAYLSLVRNISRDTDYAPVQKGQVIRIPKPGSLTANEKTANNNVTRQAPGDDKVDVTLDQHYEVTFAIEDVAKFFSNTDAYVDNYMRDAGIVLAEKVETAIAGLYSGMTYSEAGDADATIGTVEVKEGDFLAIRKRLTDNKVPKLAPLHGLVTPQVFNDIVLLRRSMGQSVLVDDDLNKNSHMLKHDGIVFEESQLVVASGSPATYHNLIYAPQAFVVALRPLPTEAKYFGGSNVKQEIVTDPSTGLSVRVTMSYDANLLGGQVTVDLLYGVALARDEFAVDLQTQS